MTTNYTNDDSDMFRLYQEGTGRMSTGMDQFTPKLQRRGNPNTRLSYASYFEEDGSTLEVGTQATYQQTAEIVNIVGIDDKTQEATIELPDETRLYHVPLTELDPI
jgi:hypothetical protein